MPTEHQYSLQELADLADVTPRTIRYYVAQGLLPSPGKLGPGTTYGDGHLARLKLIKRLAREHLPLAEIRSRVAGLDDEAVAALADITTPEPEPEAAIDYIRGLLGSDATLRARARVAEAPAPPPAYPLPSPAYPLPPPPASPAPGGGPPVLRSPAVTAEPTQLTLIPPGPERSQWERLALAPDVELHIRRPLTRHQNKRVERLISIARTIFEGDQS